MTRAARLLFVLALVIGAWLQQRAAFLRESEDLARKFREGRVRVTAAEAAANRLEAFRQEVTETESRLEQFRRIVPTIPENVAFLKRFERCGSASGARVRAFDVGPSVKRNDDYVETLISVTETGTDAAIKDQWSRFRDHGCPLDEQDPSWLGAPFVQLAHVIGHVRHGNETELGFVLFSLVLASPPPPDRAAPARKERWLWLPPYSNRINDLRSQLVSVERRAKELQVISQQLDGFGAKQKLLEFVRRLVERLKAGEPSLAQGRALLADHHWRAGRYEQALACYRAALALPDSLLPDTGFRSDGKIYLREPSSLVAGQTAYLIGVDADSGPVAERYALPGFVESFSRSGADVAIRYRTGAKDERGTLRFGAQGLEGAGLPPAALEPRRAFLYQSMALASGLLSTSIAGARLDERRFGSPPQSLREIESTLRRTAYHDPTNPWLAFQLGASLFEQGREGEATAAWNGLFEGGFPRVFYYEFSNMAYFFERLGQTGWADRAYAEALQRRKQIAVPIDASGWPGRVASAPFGFRRRDSERERLWASRARELTGILVPGEDLVARAWELYFRSNGEGEKADREHAVVEQALRHPLNTRPARLVFEGAFYALCAALASFWALLVAAARRAGAWSRGVRSAPSLTAEWLCVRARWISLTACVFLLAAGIGYVRAADHAVSSWPLAELWGDVPTAQPSGANSPNGFTRWTELDERVALLAAEPSSGSAERRDALAARLRAWALKAMQAALIFSWPVAALLLIRVAVRRDGEGRPPTGAHDADGLTRLVFGLVPGAFDLFRGALARGTLAFASFMFLVPALLFFDADSPAAGLLEPHRHDSPAWSSFLTVPGSDGGRLERWAIMGSLAPVRWLWASLALAAAVCMTLHVSRLPLVWRLPHAAMDARSGMLPRWLRLCGAGILVAQTLGLALLLFAEKIQPITDAGARTLGVPAGATMILGLLFTVAWAATAVFHMLGKRPRRPSLREAGQFAVLSLEALGVIGFLIWFAPS